jgi:RNA polymerase sigma-70 factor (ECF subfamily)
MFRNHAAAKQESFGLEYIDGLYCYAIVLTRNHAEAEDLVQEAYVRALAAMDKLRAESNLKGWLFTILRNLWLNEQKSRRVTSRVLEIEMDSEAASSASEHSSDSHKIYVRKVEAARVRSAIQTLPIEYREIIVLREYEDLSYQEIAKVLDCPLGTVMSRLARGRARLRALLEEPLKESKPERSYPEKAASGW